VLGVRVVAARVGVLPLAAVEAGSVDVVRDVAGAASFRVPPGPSHSQGCRGVDWVGSRIFRLDR
jgi:hypothetical protein